MLASLAGVSYNLHHNTIMDSDDENLVIPHGAHAVPIRAPVLAGAVMPSELGYDTEWDAFQLSIASPIGEPDLLALSDSTESTIFYQKDLPNMGFPVMENIRREGTQPTAKCLPPTSPTSEPCSPPTWWSPSSLTSPCIALTPLPFSHS